MAVWCALGARRTSTPRHVGHWATTRHSESPEPYPLPDRRLTRERRCQIIRAESCDHLVTSTGTLVLAIRRAREECRIRSAVHRGTESVGLCSPTQSAQRCMGTGVDIRGRAGSDPSARGEPHQPAGPPWKTRYSEAAAPTELSWNRCLVGAPACRCARMRYNVGRTDEPCTTYVWRAGALSEEVVSRETGCGVQLVA